MKYEFYLPRDKMNPPNTKNVSNIHVANEFANVIFLPSDPIKRNSPQAI